MFQDYWSSAERFPLKKVDQKVMKKISQPDHILVIEFFVVPLGWRYNVSMMRTNHYSKFFISSFIRLLNRTR